ncbi:MAG: Jag N-terminal domain-containing protein [Clostridia bacterium]|nr:Jag N-terminal domain-containing protein [Clostridia bacterium]
MIEIREITAAGKDVAEAKENARALLGASELDDVKFEVLHMGSRGIFGIIGVKPAQVRAYIEVEVKDREPRRPRRERPQRSERPAPAKETEVSEAEEAPEAEAGEAAPKKKSRNRRRKSGKRHEEIPTTFETTSKPKGEVIPEAELKMELREVSEGEDMPFDFICTLIKDIGLNAYAELYSCEDGTRRIAIKGEDASVLIGHHGDTLDALQYLANLASARKNANGERDKSRVTIDIEGYRAKREETLRALARRMAAKALRNKRSVMLEPMSAYERRIIHSEVQGIEGVATNSIGSDNNRKIVIYLTDKKPEELFEEETREAEAPAEVAVETSEEIISEAASGEEE